MAERRVAQDFLARGATAPADAMAYSPELAVRRRAFERLIGHDVVIAAGPGRYWLDERAWARLRKSRRTRIAQAVAFGTLAVFLASRL